jgi:hypothetical protein
MCSQPKCGLVLVLRWIAPVPKKITQVLHSVADDKLAQYLSISWKHSSNLGQTKIFN